MSEKILHTAALREALTDAMEADDRVMLMGEDIGVYGGAFGISRGLLDRFGPERIVNTPISELSFTGMAVGAALMGSRPVVEIMFADFITLAVDPLVNQAAKLHWVFGEQARCPLVVRVVIGGGKSYGPTHSQCPEAWFMHTPGLKVVAPASVQDAYGLLRSAIDDPNPVIFLEHKLLYLQKTDAPLSRAPVPLGSARVVRPGRDVTIVAYSQMVVEATRAAAMLAEHDIEAEVVDLRSLVPLDLDTVVDSVTRTGRALVVAEDTRTAGVAAEVASLIAEHAFDYLEAPVRRHTTPDVPVPAAPALEEAALPRAADIAAAAHALVGYGT